MEYKEFRVVVEDESTASVAKPSGVTISSEIRLDRLARQTIKVFSDWLAEDRIRTREELVVLGSHLFNCLFDPGARKAFKTEYDKLLREADQGLRVVLEFTEKARDFAVFPWEYIYYPDDEKEGRGFFIGTDSQLVLARHVPLKIKDLKPSSEPLRILVVVSSATREADGRELGTINAKPVLDTIDQLKKTLGHRIEITLLQYEENGSRQAPTRNELMRLVRDPKRPFHVVHLIAHGRYDDAGWLALAKEANPKVASWIKDTDLADCFLPQAQPRLIFLHACEGATSASYGAFRGLALQLVYSRIPAVVAMQYEITNKVANRFASRFYELLAQGAPIDVAVQQGRLQIGMFSEENSNFANRAFGTPVVYLQSAAGIVIAEADTRPKDAGAPAPTTALVRCPYHLDEKRCSGWVETGATVCTTCGRELAPCPNPQCKSGNVMRKDTGICRCGYRAETPAAAVTAGAQDAPQPGS